MFSINDLDPQDSRSARKSLMVVSASTLFVANLTFLSSEFSFFGFLIEISHERIVAVGRILSLVLLLIFVLKEMPYFVALLRNRSLEKLTLKHKAEHTSLADRWGHNDGEYSGDGPEAEFQDLAYRQGFEKAQVDIKYSKAAALVSFLGALLIKYSLPIALGSLAAFFPFALDATVGWLST